MRFKFSLKSLQLFFVLYGSVVWMFCQCYGGVSLVFHLYSAVLPLLWSLPLFRRCSVFHCSMFRHSCSFSMLVLYTLFYVSNEMSTIKCLFWKANDSIVKLMVSITSGVSLWYRLCYKNMLNYDNDNKCWKSMAI